MGLEGQIVGIQVQINSMENMMCEQMEKLENVIDSMTLSTRQQQKLYQAAKDRINILLGTHIHYIIKKMLEVTSLTCGIISKKDILVVHIKT